MDHEGDKNVINERGLKKIIIATGDELVMVIGVASPPPFHLYRTPALFFHSLTKQKVKGEKCKYE